MSAPLLELRAVSKVFLPATANAVKALDRVDLAVEAGDFITIIGSNGAGKSTLIRAIAGLVPLDEGSVLLEGRDMTRLPVHRRAAALGRIAQDPAESTCAVMTIEENLAMAAKRGQRRGLRLAVTPAGRERYRAALAPIGLGLEARLGARVATLSGGQRQALALLMATLSGSRLLLLDEHAASLDPKTAEIVMALTARLVQERRLTTLMVTHNMQEAIRWGDRLVMMHAGRIILDVRGEAKARLSVPELVARFHEVAEDRMLLAH
jgi:putative tryptophan/tyrosine transport system ATP-binding protein